MISIVRIAGMSAVAGIAALVAMGAFAQQAPAEPAPAPQAAAPQTPAPAPQVAAPAPQASPAAPAMSMPAPVQMPAIAAPPAPAQSVASSACPEGGKLMEQRGKLIQALSGQGKKRPTAAQACGQFGALVNNGTKILTWLQANGAWCNVPDQIATRIKDDHEQALKIRGQACNVAAQQKKMQGQAAAQARARQQGGSPFGGGGGDIVSGQMRVPQGAL